ncbi:MAG: hypothetical protein JRI41_03545 [Deltaproteobacteria bacterium]|nr:hypothetical protein [Deltaproteobacteria bacterium]RLB96604.1 MAG: hypothetical protein DRH50_00795 [Deltaproteobacteria bacterium]
MTDNIGMNITLGSGDAIKEVQRVKEQTLERKPVGGAGRRKEREKKKRKVQGRLKKLMHNESQHEELSQSNEENDNTEGRGNLLDVII